MRNNDYIVRLDYIKLESIELINTMREDLIEFGLDVELYEDDELTDPQLFKNLENMYREIREECETLPD